MNVYIKAQESVCLVHPEIKIKDIMSLYCTDKDLEQKIKNQSVYHFIGNHDQRKCFSVLMLVEVIKQVDKTLDVINLGAEDFIVYYKKDFSLWKDSLCNFSRIFWCKFFNYDI